MTTTPQSNPSPVARTVRALRHRNFRLFFFGQLVSLIGSWMQSLAQGWLVWRMTHSYFQLGLITFCQFAPVLLLGLIGGVAADRFDRHRIVVTTQALMLVQATILAALTLSGSIRTWHVMVLAVVLGTLNAFDMPGRQAFLVQMVGREDLSNAIALNSTVFNGARIAGPALAGLVVARWGEGVCFLLNAISYLAVLGSLLAMRLVPIVRAHDPRPAWERLREGFDYARRTPHVRGLLALMMVSSFFGMSYAAFLPAFAGGELGIGPTGLGWLMSFMGLGALTAAIAMAHRENVAGLGAIVPLTAAGFGVALILFAAAPHLVLAAPAIALVAFCMMTQLACTNTLLQSLVPDHLRGRLMSLYSVTFIGMSPLGSLLMGRIAAVAGLRPVLAGGGVIVVAAALSFRRGLPLAVAHAETAARSEA